MDSKSYLNIQGWMVTELGLGGTDLLIYAIVYGFTQDGQGECWSSLDYFTAWCGCDRRTVQRSIERLVDMGLISKRPRPGTTSALMAVNPRQNANPSKKTHDKMSHPHDKMSPPPTTKCQGRGDKMSHNNKTIINNDNKTISAAQANETPGDAIAPVRGVDNRGTVSPEWLAERKAELDARIKKKKQALVI